MLLTYDQIEDLLVMLPLTASWYVIDNSLYTCFEGKETYIGELEDPSIVQEIADKIILW